MQSVSTSIVSSVPATHASRRRRPRARRASTRPAPRRARRSGDSGAARARAAARAVARRRHGAAATLPRAARADGADRGRPVLAPPRAPRRRSRRSGAAGPGRRARAARSRRRQPLRRADALRLDDRLRRAGGDDAGQRPAGKATGRSWAPGATTIRRRLDLARLSALSREHDAWCRRRRRRSCASSSSAPQFSAASISARPRT